MSPRATMRITNRTGWKTEHLRAFAVNAREQVFGSERKPLHVKFRPARRAGVRGLASIRGSWSTIWIPNPGRGWSDRHALAQILVHELAHNAGAKGERWMRRSKAFGLRHPEWRENVGWAEALPLEPKDPPTRATPADKIGEALARIDELEKAWKTKAKRAATALRKLARRRAYYTRRAAALAPEKHDA